MLRRSGGGGLFGYALVVYVLYKKNYEWEHVSRSTKIIKETHDKIKQILQENMMNKLSCFHKVSEIIQEQGSLSFLRKSQPLLDLIKENDLIKTTENIKNFCTKHEFDEAIITYLVVQVAMNISLTTDEDELKNICSQYCEDSFKYFQIVFQKQSKPMPTEESKPTASPISSSMSSCLQALCPDPEIITL